jgi:hypothetical protein
VAYRTFAEWHAEKPQFAQAIKEAESKGVQTWLARIEQAANSGVWTAAAWKLERIYPHIYGRTIQEHTGLNGGPIEVADVSDRDRIASRMDELAERRRARELAQQPIRHGSEEAAV